MATQKRYCPHCGAEVGRDAYTGAALCYRCDSVFGWETTTDIPAPGTDRRRAVKARVFEIVGGILTMILGAIALFVWMFV